ncbi:MAG: phosphoglycerate kinase [Bacteroidetes bacterium]|nr:phosphoglycerate kinase [Bacteroidota bacterium]
MIQFNDYNFANKRALIRVDFNVPLDNNFNVTDDTRIRAALPTINKILKDGGSVILMSHLGRPDGEPKPEFSLKHILPKLSELLGKDIQFADDCVGAATTMKSLALQPGQVLLLENLRYHKEEEKGDETFAKDLAMLGDIYVNDAFGTAHRAHASTTIVAKFAKEKCFGYLMEGEIKSIEKVLRENQRPFTAIIGGSKVSDKVGIIENLIDKADNILIGGAMAYTFKKALGGEVGNSRIEEDKMELARTLILKAKDKGVNILLPSDSLIADGFKVDAHTQITASDAIPAGWMGLDIGKNAIKDYCETIMKSKTILWNGPMGVFEWEPFANGTKQVALAVAAATKEGAFSLIGGGDSVAAINQFHLDDQVSYISTGGGAMLECLEGKTLPGIKAIREN